MDGGAPGTTGMRRDKGDSDRGARRSRLAGAKARRASRPVWMLIAANSLPLVIFLAAGALYAKGSIEFVPGAGKVLPLMWIVKG